jgi:hypothetical protein
MRQDCATRASMRRGWHATRAGQQVAWKIASVGCVCPLRVPRAMACSIVRALSPKHGPTTKRAARAQAFPRRAAVRPRRSARRRGCSVPWTRASRPPGERGRVSMGTIGRDGDGGRSTTPPLSWPSREKPMSGVLAGHRRSQRSWQRGRRRVGVGCGLATGPKVLAGRTGGGSPWPRRCSPPGDGGSGCAGV